MGLDVYFYRKPINNHIERQFSDVVSDLCNSSSESLKNMIEALYSYTVDNHIQFESCLTEIIRSFLLRVSYPSSVEDGEEVAYFRKFWWIVNYFDYKDEDYSKDVEATKSQIEDLVSTSKKIILMVEKHFTDKGFEVERSPLEYQGSTSRWCGDRSTYLTFKNSLFTDEMIDEADHICESALGSEDAFLFYKICDMFIEFNKILETTDWDKQKIYIKADW